MKTIVTTTSSFDLENNVALRELSDQGYRTVKNPKGKRLDRDSVRDVLDQTKPVGMIAGVEPLTREVLSSHPQLKVISRCGVGLESVDLEAAQDLGILVFNTPGGPTAAVAELTLGTLLSVLRKIAEADRNIRAGSWGPLMGGLLRTRTIGLLGFGNIGREVARLCSAFGCEVLAHDPYIDQSQSAAEMTSLEDLLARADVISLHLPPSEDVREIICDRTLAQMKDNAILINMARGELVNETHVHDALTNGRLAGAAFDVFGSEPYDGPLASLDNVVLTSHMGSYAFEARQMMEKEAAENLVEGLRRQGEL